MGLGELLNALVGWLGQLIEFIISFVPRFKYIKCNEMGVRYRGGDPAEPVSSGPVWYWPWKTFIIEYNVSRRLLTIPPIVVETKDGQAVAVGMVLAYWIRDIIKYEVENFDTDESMAEVGQAALRNIVAETDWSKLGAQATEGTRLDGLLQRRMQAELTRFGVEVESARPTDQVRISRTFRIFTNNQQINSLPPNINGPQES